MRFKEVSGRAAAARIFSRPLQLPNPKLAAIVLANTGGKAALALRSLDILCK